MAGGNGAEGPFVLAIPSKGRLQEAAHAFFARAGLELIQGRGARDYRGAIAGLPGVEVAYVSSAEIVGQLGAGAAHFGVAGEDLLREKAMNVEARFELLSPLGFGHANVVVATPQDLDRRAHHGRSRRCRAGLSRQARRADAGRDKICQSHPPLLRRAWRRRLPDRREPGRDRRRPGLGRGGADRRHHDDRGDARRQCAETPRRRNDPALAGEFSSPRSPLPGARTQGRRRATSSPASRRARRR